ncbi:conserved hypothetical protein [Hyella patelloides LEGE 07179]|uniref:Uncharacterized protein n=2 Tax=Hyella TaxID=945733 RepID=A0A563VYB6_9CYAN|nr:conserved hypothetical protein [Hyella patelloides LEGE 07179]
MAVEKILNLLDEKVTELPFVDKSTVKMSTDHIVTGSPSSRSNTGMVNLRLDERWKKNMIFRDKLIISGLTLPLLYSYKYFNFKSLQNIS